MTYPEDIECSCGDSYVSITKNDYGWSAKCESCGKRAGPCVSSYVLYSQWYGLVSPKALAIDIARSITPIVNRLKRMKAGEIDSKELVKLGESDTSARGAIAILCDSGLVSARFIMSTPEGDVELSMEDALKAKRIDKASVMTLCRKKFSFDA